MNNKYTPIFLLVAAAIVLSGCKSEQDKAIEITEKEIRSTLLDPAAGIFTNVKAVSIDESGKYIVCGEVNGKNSYGAYTGAKEFNALIYNINNAGSSFPYVSMGDSKMGSREFKSFNQRRIACEKDGVQKYKSEQSRIAAIDDRIDELKSTELGSLVYSAAEGMTDLATSMGDDTEVMDVKAMFSEEKNYAYVSMRRKYLGNEFFKFKKDDSGKYVSVNSYSYGGMAYQVDVCGENVNEDICISDAEIEKLNSQSSQIKNFIMPSK